MMMTTMMVAATAMLLLLLLLMMMMVMMNHRTSFETVLQRCWQSFSPGLNFTSSFFPLNHHIQSVTAIYLLPLAKFHPLR
jgi:succinate dehydrogenase hydrophobic anchor subunit